MPRSSKLHIELARAAIVFVGVLAVPAVLGLLLVRAPGTVGGLGFLALLAWQAVALPHAWFVVRSEFGSTPWFSEPGLVALLQWTAVGLLFSVTARRLGWQWLLITAIVTVLSVGTVVHAILFFLGITYSPDVP